MMRAMPALILLSGCGLYAQGLSEDGPCLVHLPPNPKTIPLVLVLFDPGGDAAGALRRAAIAGDSQGVVLVSPVAFRNGLNDSTYSRILSELKVMLVRRFPGSPIWAGGFSGGARISVGWAQQEHGWIRGLVCFGAFYDQGGLPPRNTKVFLACGTGDFDRSEMERALAELRQSGYQVIWRSFIGGHTWPPKEVFAEAIGFVTSLTPNSPKPAMR